MSFQDACQHLAGRWEVDPVNMRFSIRCVKCGYILERITFTQAEKSPVRAIRNEMKKRGSDG